MKRSSKNDVIAAVGHNAPLAGLDAKSRAKVAEALSGFLASSYALYQKSQFYHWNVVGENFAALHAMFQAQYEELGEAVDTIAERIRAVGHPAPGTLAEFAKLSSVAEDKRVPSNARGMVASLLDGHERCAAQASKVLELAESVGDQVTVDIMVQRLTVHDKTAWMLRATLG